MNKFLVSSLAVGVAMISTGAHAGSYLTQKTGDEAMYVNVFGEQSRVAVTASNGTWQKYSNFLDAGTRWVNSTNGNEKIYIQGDNGATQLFADFNGRVGSRYNFSMSRCTTGATLAEKNATLTTEAGTFTKVMRLDFVNLCEEGGLLQAWFAPGVGAIKWTHSVKSTPTTRVAPRFAELSAAVIGSTTYPRTLGLTIKADAPASMIWTDAPVNYVNASFSLRNNGTEPLVARFTSGCQYSASLLNARGEVVRSSADGEFCTMALMDKTYAPGSTTRFHVRLPLIGRNELPLPMGSYTLRMTFNGSYAPDASVFQGTQPLSIDTPISISGRLAR